MVPSTLRRTVAIAIAALVPLVSVPAQAGGHADVGDALALPLMMRGPSKMDPQRAAALRISPQQNGKAMVDGGDPAGAGILYDRAASEYGDPILYLDAGDAYVAACEAEQNVDYCDAATERAAISLDILYFHIDSSADPTFMMVESGDVPDLSARAQTLQETASDTKDKVLNPIAEPAASAEPNKERKKGNGKGMKIAGIGLASLGGALTVVGVAGLGIGAFNQSRADDPSVYGEEYDDMRQFHTMLPKLLREGGVYSYFNGMCPDNIFFHMVYNRVAEIELGRLGFKVTFEMKSIDTADSKIWEGVKRRYWWGDTYFLPTCVYRGE